jgi:hypothetical protein
MAKFDDKVNGNTVSADEYNNMVRASKNLIEDSGQVIDSSNTQQSEAVANYVGSGNFYTDSGVANAYVLSTTGSFKAPTAYVDGMEVRFRTSNTNTGASTINVNGLGAKNIKNSDGTTDILAGFISNNRDISLRFYNDCFIPSNEITQATISTAGQSLLPDQITISNGTDSDHDIDFTAGNFQFDDGSGQAVATALTKQIDAAWVAGDNAGGLFTGSVAADTFYYCFVIKNLSTGVIDAGFDPSYSSPTLPSGYTKKAYRGAILTDGSGNIKNGSYTFFNGGYRFIYSTAVLNYSATTPAYNTYNITCPPFSLALIDGDLANSSTASYTKFQVGSTIEGGGIFSGVISSTVASRSAITPPFPIKVDSNSQIKFGYVDGIACAYSLYINGWIEYL